MTGNGFVGGSLGSAWRSTQPGRPESCPVSNRCVGGEIECPGLPQCRENADSLAYSPDAVYKERKAALRPPTPPTSP